MRLSYRTQVGTAKLCLIGIVLLCFSFGLFIIGCEESPFKPVDEEPDELEDYIVWCFDTSGASKRLIAYHPLTQVVDTFTVPWSPLARIAVSADGSLLFIPGLHSIEVISTVSLEFVKSLPYQMYGLHSWVAPSPDGQYIAIGGDSVWILDATDYSLIHVEDYLTLDGRFSADSRSLYTTSLHKTSLSDDIRVIHLDESGVTVTKKDFTETIPGLIMPTPDEKKWIQYSQVGWDLSLFEVYDVELDSIVFREEVSPGAGRLAMTPDGEFAFYGNPGTPMFGTPPTSDFTIVNLKTNEIEEVLQIPYFVDSVTPYFMPIRDIVISPDGRWLIAMDGPVAQQLLLYDLEEKEFVDYHHFGNSSWFNDLAIQSNR